MIFSATRDVFVFPVTHPHQHQHQPQDNQRQIGKEKKGILDEGKAGKTTLIMLAKNKGVVVVPYL
jgi:hypothetical protein